MCVCDVNLLTSPIASVRIRAEDATSFEFGCIRCHLLIQVSGIRVGVSDPAIPKEVLTYWLQILTNNFLIQVQGDGS